MVLNRNAESNKEDATNMSTEPAIDPMTSFAVGNRKGFAALLLAFAVLFTGLGIYGFSKGLPALRGDVAKANDPDAPPEDAAKKAAAKINPWEYLCGGLAGCAAGIVLAAIGFMQLMALPKPTEAEQRSDARTAILFAGGSVGLLLMLFGAAMFLCRTDAVNDWLGAGKTKQMMPVLTAVATAIFGAIIAFVSVIPARAEERSNPTLRKFVYGTNAGLMLLVFLGILIGINVLIGIKFPGRLDTTESGFYTLDPKTKEYLLNLDQPVIAYTTLPLNPDSNEYAIPAAYLRAIPDARRLLDECAAVNPAKITVRPLSSVSDTREINALAAKYPSMPIKEDLGILLVLGEDEKRASFVSFTELVKSQGQGKLVFEGEGRLIRELLFLADNKSKTVVYVTQGSGEMSLMPPRRQTDRTMSVMAEKLGMINCDVRPLVFDDKVKEVPTDAGLVIVANPTSSLSKEAVAAIAAYARPVDPNKPKGKLLVLAGASPSADGKTLATNGLEELLATWGITLGMEQIFCEQYSREAETIQYPVVTVLPESQSPVAREFANRPFPFPRARMVSAAPAAPGQPTQAESLLETKPGTKTFLDVPDLRSAFLTYTELAGNASVREAKKFGPEPRSVAVTVRDGPTTRAIVIGSGEVFSDQWLQRIQPSSYAVELFAGLVDALRERPAVASLASKDYGTYLPPSDEHMTRMFWLPILLVPLVVAAIGVGVWVVRRK
jgi:uncharacterized membrane protein